MTLPHVSGASQPVPVAFGPFNNAHPGHQSKTNYSRSSVIESIIRRPDPTVPISIRWTVGSGVPLWGRVKAAIRAVPIHPHVPRRTAIADPSAHPTDKYLPTPRISFARDGEKEKGEAVDRSATFRPWRVRTAFPSPQLTHPVPNSPFNWKKYKFKANYLVKFYTLYFLFVSITLFPGLLLISGQQFFFLFFWFALLLLKWVLGFYLLHRYFWTWF